MPVCKCPLPINADIVGGHFRAFFASELMTSFARKQKTQAANLRGIWDAEVVTFAHNAEAKGLRRGVAHRTWRTG